MFIRLEGVFLIAAAIIGIYMGNIYFIFIGFVCAAIIYFLRKIISVLEGIHYRLLGLQLTEQQIDILLQHSSIYDHESEALELSDRPYSKLITLDGHQYVNSKLFKKYITTEEFLYTIHFPNAEPIQMYLETVYTSGVELFRHRDHNFVRVDKLGIPMRKLDDSIVWG